MHADLERFKGWLKDNHRFNSQIQSQLIIFKQARKSGGSKCVSTLSSPEFFRCELILDMIAIQDSDVEIALFISSSYPFIEEIACEYVFGILSEELDSINRHKIRVSVAIQNDYFSSSLSEFRQLEILSTQLRSRESIAGELASFARVRILQLFPESMFSSLRIFESECTCEKASGHSPKNNNNRGRQFVIKNNLITHFCEKQGAAIGNCRICNSPRIEDQSQRVLEQYQQALVFIPCMQNVSQSKGIYTMYIQKSQNDHSALAVNAWYSCLAYYVVQPLVAAQKMISSSCLLSEYQDIQVKEYLFALRVSTETKSKNIGFAEKLLDAMNEARLFLIQDEIGREEEAKQQQQKNKGQSEDDFDPNFHFRFKQLAFASEVVFSAIGNQSPLHQFACLHLKMALTLSYVSNNSTHLLGLVSQEKKNQESTDCQQTHLHVKMNCSHAFYERIADLVEGVFVELDDFMVFDARQDCSQLMNVLIQVGSGILFIKHASELSKGAAEIISKVLMKQPVQFDKLKTALVLPITVWSLVEVSDEFGENNQSMNGGNRRKAAAGSNLNGINQSLFDIILSFDKTAMSAKDYTSMLSLFVESYSTEMRERQKMSSHQGEEEIEMRNKKYGQIKQEGYYGIVSPVRQEKKGIVKRQIDVVNYSTNRKSMKMISSLENVSTEKLSRVRRESAKTSSPKVLIANEVQAFELMESFVNTARANSQKRINAVYTMNNAASVAKVARTTALFTQMFVNQADAENWMIENDMSNSQARSMSRSQSRVGIDVFDAFIGMIYNVLSRELFTGLIDKSYLMSFFVNYGIGYQGNDDFVIPQEKEFYLAFDKIQDMVANLIDFEEAQQ